MTYFHVFLSFYSKLEVSLPDIDYIEVPAPWWDAEADKSLLIGVHKHGEALSSCLPASGTVHLMLATIYS